MAQHEELEKIKTIANNLVDRLHEKENEIARLLTENIQLRRELEGRTAPDICSYAIDGCVLENQEIGPCLCAARR